MSIEVELQKIETLIADHTKDDNIRFGEIQTTLNIIKENHLHHIEIDIALVKKDISYIKEWIESNKVSKRESSGQDAAIDWNTWIIRTALGALITLQIVNLLK